MQTRDGEGPVRRKRRILLTNNHLEVRAGSELVTTEVAEELQRRGHAVALFTLHRGYLAEEFSSRTGIPVLTPLERTAILEWNPDTLHIHHWPSLAYLRSIGLLAPATIGFLGVLPDLENPPPLAAQETLPWWAVSEEALSNVQRDERWRESPHALVRNWFDDRQPRAPVLAGGGFRSILVVSNHFPDQTLTELRSACLRIGAEVHTVGLPDNPRSVDAELLGSHDAVVTLGRTAIHAMSLGIPVLVLDQNGCDGWVTSESVSRLAEHNFSGRALRLPTTPEALSRWMQTTPTRADLVAVQEWAWTNCTLSAAVDTFEDLHAQAEETSTDRAAPLWQRVVGGYVQSTADLAHLDAALRSAHDQMRTELDAAIDELTQSRAAAASAQSELDQERQLRAEILDSQSWRLTKPLRSAAKAARWTRDRVDRGRSGSGDTESPPSTSRSPYDSHRLSDHADAAYREFRAEERRLGEFRPAADLRTPQVRRSSTTPPLSWLAELREEGWTFTLGSGVERLSDGFFEGAWDGDFDVTRPWNTKYPFGSGARLDRSTPLFVQPCHPRDALYVVGDDRTGRSWVSNSLAYALLAAGVESDSGFFRSVADRIREHTTEDNVRGVDRSRPTVVEQDHLVLRRMVFHKFEVGRAGTVRRSWSLPSGDFSTFEEYRALLSGALSRIIANGSHEGREQRLRAITAVSKGYDSVAVSALVAELGVSDAMTLAVEVYGREDSGLDVGQFLGLRVTEHQHLMGRLIEELNMDSLPDEYVQPALEFLATHGRGDDINHLSFESRLAGALFFSGNWGDTIWARSEEPSSGLAGGPWGSSLGEYRLRVGFAWVPVPYIGARFAPAISELAHSAEMLPYTLGTDYDRPIPRRISEEAGVPRGQFGQAKTATAPYVATHSGYFTAAILAMWDRYRDWQE